MTKRIGMLINTSTCIGCRTCQVSCKQWKELDAGRSWNTGTYENPAHLSANLLNRVRFIEKDDDNGQLHWRFFNRRCMQCGEPACIKVCPVSGAIVRAPNGAVVYNKSKCISCKYCLIACPFNIPRFDENGKISKCNFCAERVDAGMEPACSKACPTNSLQFGEWNVLLAKAKASGQTPYGARKLQGTGVLYLLEDSPESYGLPTTPEIPTSVLLWKDVMKPLALVGVSGSLAAVLLHYIIFRSRQIAKETTEQQGEEDA